MDSAVQFSDNRDISIIDFVWHNTASKKHIINNAFSSWLLVKVAQICCILPESWRVISSRHVGSSSHYGQLTVHTIHEPRFQLYWRNKRLRLAIVTLSGGKSKQPIYDNGSECKMLWLLRTRETFDKNMHTFVRFDVLATVNMKGREGNFLPD